MKHTPGRNQRMRRNHEPRKKPHRRVLHPRCYRHYVVGIAMNDPRTKEQAMEEEAVAGLHNVVTSLRDAIRRLGPQCFYGDLPSLVDDMILLKECVDAIGSYNQVDAKIAKRLPVTEWTANMEVGDEIHQ